MVKCNNENCNTTAAFGPLNGAQLTCKKHMLPYYVFNRSKKVTCQHNDCNASATHGASKNAAKSHCNKHKLPEAMDLTRKYCEHDDCQTRAHANSGNRFCFKHDPENSEDQCKEDDCYEKATYGQKDTLPDWCKVHKLSDSLDLNRKYCEYDRCNIGASFGLNENSKMQFCKSHAPENYIDLNNLSKICREPNCKIRGSFGPKDGKSEYCKSHAPEDYVDLISKLCECNRVRPSFGLEEDGIAKWCVLCKPDEAVDVKSRKCACGKSPSYGLPEGSAEWCFTCPDKPVDAICVRKHKLCVEEDCETRATFSFKGGEDVQFCKKHAPPDATDPYHKKCEHEGCESRPSFRLKEEEKERWCSKHAPNDAVDNYGNRCEKCELVLPSFGYDFGYPQWCKKCKPEDAVNVVSKLCKCGKSQATFAKEGETPQYCADCKPVEAVNVRSKKCACGKHQPSFGKLGEKAIHCLECKISGDIDVVSKRCLDCDTQVKSPYKYCCTCDPETRARRHSKEAKVYQYLLNNLPTDLSTILKSNQGIGTEFNFKKYRQDSVITLIDRTINIEVDEHEHSKDNPFYDFRGNGQYTPVCEVKRMYEIATQNGGHFLNIRFNTDIQRDKDGVPVPKISKKRLELLKTVIESYTKMEVFPRFMVIFMFYSPQRYGELEEEFVNCGLGEDIRQYLHLVSYDSNLDFLN